MPKSKFQDYSFGESVRLAIGKRISSFIGQNQTYSSQELRVMLIEVFKFKQYEVSYELLKILFFGKNKYQNVSLAQLINYIVQKHLGENSINEYSLKCGYLHSSAKIMTKLEFVGTINLGLEFLQSRNPEKATNQLHKIFQTIDTNTTGTISHDDYMQFLREFFGSQSPIVTKPTQSFFTASQRQEKKVQKPHQVEISIDSKISRRQAKQFGLPIVSKYNFRQSEILEELRDLIISEIREKCSQFDGNKDGSLNRRETYQFFYHILQLQRNSIEYILDNYFNFNENEVVEMNQLVEVICQVHFRQIFSTLLKQEMGENNPNKLMMNQDLFRQKLVANCFFFKKKPSEQLIYAIFQQLENRSELKIPGCISLEDFRSYVLIFLCNNRLIFRKSSKKHTHSAHNAMVNMPLSIAEVQNSHYEEDSQCNQVCPKEFDSFCEPYQSKLLREHPDHQEINSSNHSHRVDIRYADVATPKSSIILEPHNSFTLAPQQKNISHQHITESAIFEPNSQSITELVFSNRQRKKNQAVTTQTGLKNVLWISLKTMMLKYCKINDKQMSRSEALMLFQNEPSLVSPDSDIKKKIIKYFQKSARISIQLLISYLIHLKGEETLIRFNASQIKGKSFLLEPQVSSLLYEAYGSLPLLTSEMCSEYASSLKYEPTNQLSYQNYLSTIGRNLSQNPTFDFFELIAN